MIFKIQNVNMIGNAVGLVMMLVGAEKISPVLLSMTESYLREKDCRHVDTATRVHS